MRASNAAISTTLLVTIGAIAVLAYYPSLHGPFVFDDAPALTQNAQMQFDPLVLDEWRTAIWSSESGAFRRVVAMVSFAINHVAAGGLSPFVFKATNLTIHLSIGALVFGIAANVTRALGHDRRLVAWVALLAAALWVLHPLHVTTVAYVVQRMAQLSTLFVCLGLFTYLRFRVRWLSQSPTVDDLLACCLWLALFLFLGLYAKENAVLLLWFVAFTEWVIFRGRLGFNHVKALQLAAGIVAVLPLFIGSIYLFANLDSLVLAYETRNFTLEERVLTQLRVLWQYVAWLVIPDINSMGFLHDDFIVSSSLLAPWSTLLALVGWAALVVVVVLMTRKYRLLAWSLGFFLIGHSLESSFFPLEMVFEHRNYLPSVGVVIGLSYVITLTLNWLNRQNLGRVLVITLVLLFFWLTHVRATAWSSDSSLFLQAVVHHPNSPRSNYSMAHAIARHLANAGNEGLDIESIEELRETSRYHFEQAFNLQPSPGYLLPMLDRRLLNDKVLSSQDVIQRLQSIDNYHLQATDYNGLAGFVDCALKNFCQISREEVLQVIGLYSAYSERHPVVLLQEYQYLRGAGSSPHEYLPPLQLAVDSHPSNRNVLYHAVLESLYTEDFGPPYLRIGNWLAADEGRWSLSDIRRTLVAEGGESVVAK